MLLVICGFALAGLAGLLVWYASSRWWHPIAIGFPALALFPWVATYVAGDVSRYLPAGLFSDSQQGKDEIAVASAYATIIISIALAGVGFWLTGGVAQETVSKNWGLRAAHPPCGPRAFSRAADNRDIAAGRR